MDGGYFPHDYFPILEMSTSSSQFSQSSETVHSQNCIEHLQPQITEIGNSRRSTDLAQDCVNRHGNDNFKGNEGITLVALCAVLCEGLLHSRW